MNSGGKRAGAGRPKIAEEERRVVLSCRVAPATLAALQAAARKRRLRIGTLLDALAADLDGVPAGSFVEAPPVPFKAPVEAHAPAPGPLPGPLDMEPVEETEEDPVEVPVKAAPKAAQEEPRKAAPKAAQEEPKKEVPKETSGQGFRVKWTPKAAPVKATKEELTVNGETITMETIEAFRKDRDEIGVPRAFMKAAKQLPSGVAARLMELAYKEKI